MTVANLIVTLWLKAGMTPSDSLGLTVVSPLKLQ